MAGWPLRVPVCLAAVIDQLPRLRQFQQLFRAIRGSFFCISRSFGLLTYLTSFFTVCFVAFFHATFPTPGVPGIGTRERSLARSRPGDGWNPGGDHPSDGCCLVCVCVRVRACNHVCLVCYIGAE